MKKWVQWIDTNCCSYLKIEEERKRKEEEEKKREEERRRQEELARLKAVDEARMKKLEQVLFYGCILCVTGVDL